MSPSTCIEDGFLACGSISAHAQRRLRAERKGEIKGSLLHRFWMKRSRRHSASLRIEMWYIAPSIVVPYSTVDDDDDDNDDGEKEDREDGRASRAFSRITDTGRWASAIAGEMILSVSVMPSCEKALIVPPLLDRKSVV